MNLYNITDLKAFLQLNKLAPSKNRGQNFLINQEFLQKMAQLIPQNFPLLEIGPGLGHFTHFLLKKQLPLTCVEIDAGFVNFLNSQLKGQVDLIHADFLKLKWEDLSHPTYTLVGNIPYSLSQEILLALLQNKSRLSSFYLLVQKEFALKLCAPSNTKSYNRMSVLTQAYTTPKILLTLPGNCFYPAPKVDSVFMEFFLLPNPYCSTFEKIITHLFSTRRKFLSHGLKSFNPQLLQKVPLDWHHKRIENLTPQELYHYLALK